MSESVKSYNARIRAALELETKTPLGGLMFDCINAYESSWLPGRLNAPNSVYFHYFFKYLLQDIYSIFDFQGLPEDWQPEYMIYNLLCRGWIAFVNADPYGWIPQPCAWGGERNVFAFPLSVLVCNGWFNPAGGQLEYQLKDKAFLLHTSPDFTPLADIAAFYADKLSCLYSTMNNSAILSRNGYITVSDNKAKSLTYEKALEGILNSEFIVSLNARKNAGESIMDNLELLETDVQKHYIVDKILMDVKETVDQFHSDIGFPSVNRGKKERVQSSEQIAISEANFGKPELWFDILQKDLEAFNAASGLDLSVRRREPDEAREVFENGTIPKDTTINTDQL